MERIADRKIHFAPLGRQMDAIEKLLREGEARNVTELMRRALDHYLSARGRPRLEEQARLMADDFHAARRRDDGDSAALQEDSRETDETW
jgi:Arc/MetJ-type ribon-helix-helix transcriptional regulator